MSTGSKSPMLQRVLICAIVLALLGPSALAQQTSGGIRGTITDQLGSLVVGATVLANDARGVERKATTNQSGNYDFRALPAGRYDLRVIAPGFTDLETKNVEVASGKPTILDLQLDLAPLEQSVTVDNKDISTDSDMNADAIVLRQSDLEALPNDPAALLSALQAMAGPTEGEGGTQIKVDGFSNGQLPPKEAIREVRINQNPYSAENEFMGWNGIEIFTQPGSDKFHGGGSFNFNDESLNSRNAFVARKAPYQQRGFNGNLTGPIKPKRASFAFYTGHYGSDNNSVVNATILDPVTLRPVLFSQTFVTPTVSFYMSGRGDLKLNKKHTLVGNYEYGRGSQELQGIGGFSLPSRAFRGERSNHTLQLTETAMLSEKVVNETRLMLSTNISRQIADTIQPALNVADSFFGGGSQIGSTSNRQDRFEAQNFTSWSAGKHFIKAGGRFRFVRLESISPSNFGGTYTFAGGVGPLLDANDQLVPGGGTIPLSSLERYRRTLLFQRAGLSAAQIRSLGGGATQFSIAGGNPQASVSQRDISMFIQDEWKVRPNLTISPGLRYEDQSNIVSVLNFAPRVGFAWSPTWGSVKKPAALPTPPSPNANATKSAADAKPAPVDAKSIPADAKSITVSHAGSAPAAASAAPKPPKPQRFKTVMRGGFGVFYYRLSEDLILQTRRFNGLNQQQFVVTDPTVLNLFPVVPPIGLLSAFAQPQTRRFLSENVAPGAILRSSFSVEQQLDPNLKLTVTYYHTRTYRTLRTVNINAPLGTTGLRPLGASEGNIQESQSNGRTISHSLSVGVNGAIKKFNFWSNYNLNRGRSTDSGASGAPFDPYDFSQEWGRSTFTARHNMFAGGYYQTKSLLSFNMFMVATSGRPFDITTGRDTNRDNSFAERPAFATDLTKPGVVVTPLGAFDPNPVAGQKIIPRNFGTGPSFISLNIGIEKTFKFGRAIPPKAPPGGAVTKAPTATSATSTTTATTTPTTAAATSTAAPANAKPLEKPAVQRPYSFGLSIYASNALNRVNKANPVGNMASPYFLQSTSVSNNFFFGPGGGGSGGNRQVTVRLRLSF